MNINKINKQWPVLCSDALATIDRMNTWEAYKCGLITKEEREAIVDDFVCQITLALETKSYVTAEEIHCTPKSEIVKRFRKGLGQEKAVGGCSGFPIP
jgi:hypothetical protein